MKKKVVIGGFSLLVILVLYAFVSNIDRLRLGRMFFEGRREEVTVGDLVIPVTATGTIEPARLTQIKSKANGEVMTIQVVEGQMIQTGEVLIELDPVDEKRIVKTREAALERAASALEKMKIAVEDREKDLPLQTRMAQARLEDADARLGDAKYRLDRLTQQVESGAASDFELVVATTAFNTAKSAKDQAIIELERAKKNETILLRSAKEDVKQADASLREAQKALDEATLRLEETTVRAPSDGMVYSITVRIGEMIQSGTQSFTGGTTLMVLADTRSMFVNAQIDEADIGSIREIAPAYARPGETRKLGEEEYRRRAMRVIEHSERKDHSEADGENDVENDPSVRQAVQEMEGRPVEVRVDAYQFQEYQGVIERILPEPQRVSNAIAFNVRIRLLGDDLQKLMGLQADLSFKTKTLEQVVMVKNDSLHSEGLQCYVYVPHQERGSGRWGEKKISVEIGPTDGIYTQIESGLEPGDEVWVRRPIKRAGELRAGR